MISQLEIANIYVIVKHCKILYNTYNYNRTIFSDILHHHFAVLLMYHNIVHTMSNIVHFLAAHKFAYARMLESLRHARVAAVRVAPAGMHLRRQPRRSPASAAG